MDIKEQVSIIEAQLSCFDNLMDKMQYLAEFFDPDPEFTKEATDIVRSNMCREIKG